MIKISLKAKVSKLKSEEFFIFSKQLFLYFHKGKLVFDYIYIYKHARVSYQEELVHFKQGM